ncbi:unnamed protein product [Peronospora destructor]|uniref:Alanyl-tRNA synthetase class IIc N-terminal domain-containing protein n=1 Tax=Peronospora destructor TaxID=86335 RepID=A0AAV0U6R7_9STRA|nr:unnamed protein product [Peronospora destructor]
MQFEHVASILQGKDSMYDTDVFTPLPSVIEKSTNAALYAGTLGRPGRERQLWQTTCEHVVGAITDGAVSNNYGRGYVLHCFLCSMRYGQQFWNAPSGFLSELVRL